MKEVVEVVIEAVVDVAMVQEEDVAIKLIVTHVDIISIAGPMEDADILVVVTGTKYHGIMMRRILRTRWVGVL